MNDKAYAALRDARADLVDVLAQINDGAEVDYSDLAEIRKTFEIASALTRAAARSHRETIRACIAPADPHTFAECKNCPNFDAAPDGVGYCCAITGRAIYPEVRP